jgi:chemotaxis protein MotB
MIFGLASCSTAQNKQAMERLDAQKAQAELSAWDLQLQLDAKNAELKRVTTERDNLARDNEDLNKSLRAKSDQLSQRIAALSSDKQALEKRIATLQQTLDMQKAKEDRDLANTKSTYDQLMTDLKKEVDNKSVEVQQYKGMLTINMVDQIFFDSGKADIKSQGYSVLDRVGAILKTMPDKIVQIEGHTDDVPIAGDLQKIFPNNWALGSRRAVNVATYFIDKVKLDPMHIEVVSFSKYRPRVPNTSAENRAKNRRIEIVIVNRSINQLMEMKEGSKQ